MGHKVTNYVKETQTQTENKHPDSHFNLPIFIRKNRLNNSCNIFIYEAFETIYGPFLVKYINPSEKIHTQKEFFLFSCGCLSFRVLR